MRRRDPYFLEAQLRGAGAAGLLVGFHLLLLVMQVPQHVARVLLLALVYARVLGVGVCPLQAQQLLSRDGGGGGGLTA